MVDGGQDAGGSGTGAPVEVDAKLKALEDRGSQDDDDVDSAGTGGF